MTPQEPSGHKKTACGVFGWPAPEEFCFAKFFPQMANGSPLQLLLTLYGEGCALLRRAGALRSRLGPLLAEQRYARVQRASNARHLGARRDRLPQAAGPLPHPLHKGRIALKTGHRGRRPLPKICFFCLPLVVAIWRAMQNKHLCLSPKPSLQSGKGAVSKGGSLWLTFFRPFFVQQQRKDITTAQRGAKPYFASEIASFVRPLNTGVMQA